MPVELKILFELSEDSCFKQESTKFAFHVQLISWSVCSWDSWSDSIKINVNADETVSDQSHTVQHIYNQTFSQRFVLKALSGEGSKSIWNQIATAS